MYLQTALGTTTITAYLILVVAALTTFDDAVSASFFPGRLTAAATGPATYQGASGVDATDPATSYQGAFGVDATGPADAAATTITRPCILYMAIQSNGGTTTGSSHAAYSAHRKKRESVALHENAYSE
jgi:hypothetical protein